MTRRHWKIAAFICFGLLGMVYAALVVLPISAVGASWILSPASLEEEALLITLCLRMAGALLCIAVLLVLARLPRGRAFGAAAAWALALGATAVVIWDTASTSAPAGVWGVVALVVLLHLWLVRTFYLASRHEAS